MIKRFSEIDNEIVQEDPLKNNVLPEMPMKFTLAGKFEQKKRVIN